jgi:hypothetical protein
LPEYDAIEYSVRFHNSGDRRSGGIGKVNALAASFDQRVLNGSYVLSSGGGVYDGTYPPEAFAVRKHWFSPVMPSDEAVTLGTEGRGDRAVAYYSRLPPAGYDIPDQV